MAAVRVKVAKQTHQITSENAQRFMDDHDTFLFDCDGVLWHGSTPFPGVVEFLNILRKLGKHVYFITNNSTKSRAMLLEKMQKLGIQAELDEALTSSYIAAHYLKNILDFKGKVYMIGNKAMCDELDEVGIKYTGGVQPDPVPENFTFDASWTFEKDPDINCVLVGFDPCVNFSKVIKTTTYLYKKPDVLFIATNADEMLPSNGGFSLPGTGSIVSFVKTPCEREPIIVGKPSKHLFEVLEHLDHIDPKRTVMVGDRMSTDILFAHNINCTSLLVLTGVHQLDDVERCANSDDQNDRNMVPDFYMPCIGDFTKLLT
ncbi:glycerol-3-phosphate phosphatase-like [Tubulanus polymorphus]|uniref:glycerol-3-phosphate phosphatase-like n=1 Tax=Tubulanus polymorphus TaxID=672921 RepID=UPI003DA24609